MAEGSTELHVKHDGDVTVVAVMAKHIPVEFSDEFEAGVLDAIQGDPVPRVVLDFEFVDFISSVILGKLIKLNGILLDRGGAFNVCCLSPKIAVIFKMMRLHKLIGTHKTREQATQACR